MAQNITEEEKILLACAKWGDMIEVDNSAVSRISSTWICIINGILAIHGAFLNALIITVYYKDRRLQTISNVLIVALAMADLSVCLIGQPVAIVIHSLKLYRIHSCILELTSFLLTEFGIGLSCTVVCLVIPIERSLALFFPLKHRTLVTKQLLKTAIVVSSLIYMFAGVIFTFFVSLQIFFSLQLLGIILGMAFVAAVYSRIFILVHKKAKTGRISQGVTPDNPPSPPRRSIERTPRHNCHCKSTPYCNVCKKIAAVENQAQHTSYNCPLQTAEKAAPPRRSIEHTPHNCPSKSTPNCNVCKKIAAVENQAQHTSNNCSLHIAEKASPSPPRRSIEHTPHNCPSNSNPNCNVCETISAVDNQAQHTSNHRLHLAEKASPSPPRRSILQTPHNCLSKSTPNCNVCKKIAAVDNQAPHTSNHRLHIAEKAAQRCKKEKQVLKTMVIIFGALVLSFLPRAISIMCMIFGVTDVQMFYNYFLPWTDLMTYSNSSLNPYIYFFKKKDICEATKRILFGRTPGRPHGL